MVRTTLFVQHNGYLWSMHIVYHSAICGPWMPENGRYQSALGCQKLSTEDSPEDVVNGIFVEV